MQPRPALGQLCHRRLSRGIPAERDEELDLEVVIVGEHPGDHAAPAAGASERSGRVHDRPRPRKAIDLDEVDPFDVTDDRDPRHRTVPVTRARSIYVSEFLRHVGVGVARLAATHVDHRAVRSEEVGLLRPVGGR